MSVWHLTDDLDMAGHHLVDWRYLDDIPRDGALTGDVLTFNGDHWAPAVVASGGGGVSSWNDLEDVPATFPPEDHTHVMADITDLVLEEAIVIAFDGGGTTLAVDKKGDYVVPFDMTITAWDMLADQSGSVEIGVWKDTYANYPPLIVDVLVSPSITAATQAQATGLELSVLKDDILRFNINSATTVQRVTLALKGVRDA